jgi:hypothetical protein
VSIGWVDFTVDNLISSSVTQRARPWQLPGIGASSLPVATLATFVTGPRGSFLPLVDVSIRCVIWILLNPF